MAEYEPEMGHLLVLQERRDWLAARIQAKKKCNWETHWDEREHSALAWAITLIERREAYGT